MLWTMGVTRWRGRALIGYFVSATVLSSAYAVGAQPDRSRALLLPTLVAASPQNVRVQAVRTRFGPRWLLRFTTAIGNLGSGPLIVRGVRRAGETSMSARQIVVRADGAHVTLRVRARLGYSSGEGHNHWHVLRFAEYRLVSAEGSVMRVGHKAGFCLGDDYEVRQPPVRRPEFLYSPCGGGQPRAMHVLEGITPGYGDVYPSSVAGQDVDITGLPAGRYVLVNRVNPQRFLRESSRAVDEASVLLSLTWTHGGRRLPRVRVIRRCRADTTC